MAQKQTRFLGVQPFKTSDRNIFFGRDDEIERLGEHILLEKLTVLFGKSGYGKSSLLSAGIVPRLTDEAAPEGERFRPVEVRFYTRDEFNPVAPLDRVLMEISKLPAAPELAFLSETEPKNALWAAFKMRQKAATNGQFVLIFDQFEELFSYPADEQAAFRWQLAELLLAGVPASVRGRLEGLAPDVRQAVAEPMQVKAVFAIRADRMAALDSMKDALPAILHKRIELRALPRPEAEKALTLPAGLEGDFESPKFGFEPAATAKILNFLEDENRRIDPIQLQILAESFETRAKNGETRFGTDNLGDLKKVIANYYSEKIEAIADPAERHAARRLCEEFLVQDSAPPIRLTLHEWQIERFLGIKSALLGRLVDSRLLRAEMVAGGGRTYELPHDTLLEPILEAKKVRKKEEAAAELVEIERKRRRAFLAQVAATGLILVAIGASIFAIFQKEEAEKAIEFAKLKSQKADEAEKLANDASIAASTFYDSLLVAEKTVDLKTKEAKNEAKKALLKKLEAEKAEAKAFALLEASKMLALTKLPENFDALIPLDSLDFSGWGFSSISSEIGKLVNLKKLNLESNLLTVLPAEIGELKNLTSLNLCNNQLTALPAEIGELKNLTSLNLHFNQLTALPAEIGELKNLTSLYLSGNRLPHTEKGKIKKLLPNCKIEF